MSLPFLTLGLLQVYFIAIIQAEICPSECTCETAPLSNLPINSVLVKSQRTETTDLPSYQNRNEVLDETDERQAEHQLGEDQLKAATCMLQPTHNLQLLHSLPPDLQVLTILQGPSTANITLDESYFQHLQKLVVLEIHGFPHGHGVLRLRNNALKHLENLCYLNLQHLHLLGNQSLGNRPAPLSGSQFIESNVIPGAIRFTSHEGETAESNTIPEAIQFNPDRDEMDIVPYSVYQDQQERAGLSTFTGLRSLVFLRAFHCNVKEVNWEMFDGLQQLEYLSLEGNKIPFLHEFSFYGTPNLKHLIMSHNKLLSVHSTGLAGLLKLEVLDLSYNNISHMSELSLPPLPTLTKADFHHNPIEQILPHTFQVMNNTEQLFLGGKYTELEIRHNSFLGLNKVRKLSLNGVHLEALEREYLKGMFRLRQLKIEGSIHELAFDAFAEVPKLEELILKHCSIRKISMDAFFGLYGLIYLDLSYNELETLPPSLFDHQHSLKEINLYKNKLTTLPEGLFLHIPAKLIRLDKNPWHCTCSMNEWQPSQINKVKVKITDNSLCQIRYDKGSMCKIHYMYQYVYEQSVSPRCTTPARFSGWSVFHMLRKHLRCHNKLYHHKFHSQKEKPSKMEMHISRNIHKTDHLQRQLNYIMTTVSKNYLKNVESFTKTFTIAKSALKLSTTDKLETYRNEHTTESAYDYTNVSVTDHKTTEIQHNETQMIEINQNMWTEKDKEKYKILQEKEERASKRSNATTAVKKDKPVHNTNFKMNVNMSSKIKKQSDTLKKWDMKMQDTMKRLNKALGSEVRTP